MSLARARLKDTPAALPRADAATWRKLAFALCLLASGLLGWRAIAIFTAPASSAAPSSFERIAETVTGTHQVRVEQGENGALLILINGEIGALANADVTKLRSLAAALYPSAPPAIVRQYPFATGALARPSNSALGELGVLGLLVMLSGWLVLSLTGQKTESTQAHRKTHSAPLAEQPVSHKQLKAETPAPELISPVDKALQMAQKDPEATAEIIRIWLRQEEGHA